MSRIIYQIFILILLVSCIEEGSRRTSRSGSSEGSGGSKFDTNNNGSGASGGVDFGNTSSVTGVKVELTHVIDPIDGNYSQKLSLPKNYRGEFYLAGINLESLAQSNLKLRFYFGQDDSMIEVPALLGKTVGLTNNAELDVLVLDFSSRPFEDIRLPYDLFDYNDYEFDGSTSSDALEDPVQDNRNSRLYCRGLNLQDDPSYIGVGSCSQGTDQCLYSYAKIRDTNLYSEASGSGLYIPTFSSKAQIDESSSLTGYYSQSDAQLMKACLPDIGFNPTISNNIGSVNFGDTFSVNGINRRYLGPYEPNNFSSWAIQEEAIFGAYGVFKSYIDGAASTTDYEARAISGAESYLFPRYTQVDLGGGVQYIGTDAGENANETKSPQVLSSAGTTSWMDGCNARVRSFKPIVQEHIGSCNVTGRMELIATDWQTNVERVVEVNREIKLQLLTESLTNTDNEPVLGGSFSSCSSSSSCSSDSCCFNGRCWSKSIVSQCLDETQSSGNYPIGVSCSSDLQCSSLCCDQSNGRCAVHDNTLSPPQLCGKAAGQRCIARQWCRQYSKPRCKIVRTGPGSLDCDVRCENVLVYGECQNGYCTAPSDFSYPNWNPTDPNRCDEAE